MLNKAGNFVKPDHKAFMAAASAADWSVPGFAASVIDQAGPESWPIVAPTFILLPTNPTDAARNAIVRRFFDWCFANGSQLAVDLEYIPLPESVHNAVRASWRQSFGA